VRKLPPKDRNEKPQSKRRGWARFISFLIIGSFSILLGGFFSFAQHVDNIQPPTDIPTADGIVVWTGKGGGRLQAGVDLLTAKKGERLLISGVHEDNNSTQIMDVTGLSQDLTDCCLERRAAFELRPTPSSDRTRANGINPETGQNASGRNILSF